jgi:Bacterial protein of unknown function (DUF839)
MKHYSKSQIIAALGLAISASAGYGQTVYTTGPSSSQTPYIQATGTGGLTPFVDSITSIVTTKDLVQKTGAASGTTYEVGGVPDGIGAYDNGNGTFTMLVNHEILTSSLGAVRDHGAKGAYVEELIVNKSTLAVVSSSDLIKNVIDTSGVVHNATNSNAIAFGRFCSADLAPATGLYNSNTGLGTTERLFMHGEEGPVTGYNLASVASGANKGNSYILGKFNLSTNGSGLTGVGSWENSLVNPYMQDKTVVAANSDGGTGIQNGTVMIYQGTKTNTGTEVDRAGLTNGTLKFVNVAGHFDASGSTIDELANTTTRASAITSGTAFTLSGTTSTTFSRPEDGAWNPTNPSQYYFVTTDRLDTSTASGGGQTNPTVGATGATAGQIGMSRLWRLTFTDITNPDLGGKIDLLIDGGKAGQKVQMFDNMTVDANGRIFLNEDPGNSTYNGKIWTYDPGSDQLTMLTKFDPARWGDLASAGGTPGATSPQTDDKETSGILDVSSIFGPGYLLTTVQDHSTLAGAADSTTTEGGQLLLIHATPEPSRAMLLVAGLGAAVLRRRRK